MHNLGIHFGTSFVFDRIDYDARQQLNTAQSIIGDYTQGPGCMVAIHISGNQTLVQQLAKDLAGSIPYTTSKSANPKITDTHVIPNNR